MADLDVIKGENEQLLAEKKRLEEKLAAFEGGDSTEQTKETDNIAHVRKIFDLFNKNKSGEIGVREFQDIAFKLGETLTDAEAKRYVAQLDLDKNGTLNFDEFYSWWSSDSRPSKDSKEDSTLNLLKLKLHSRCYLHTLTRLTERLRELQPQGDDKIFRGNAAIQVGEFDEARATIQINYTNDPAIGKASRVELKATPTAAILSVSFTLKPDIDEFELGELAGSIGDIVLMGKEALQFHSHKTQLATERGEKVMRFTVFYDEHEQLEKLKPVFAGAELQALEGTLELSQRPGDKTSEFVMARGRGHLEIGVGVVAFFTELLFEHKSEAFRSKVNLLSTFRSIDLNLKFDRLDEPFKKAATKVEQLRDITGFHSLKPLITMFGAEIANDNSIPDALKETYFCATKFLRGVHSLRFQVDNQVINVFGKGIDIFSLLPEKDDITNYRAPPPSSSSGSSSSQAMTPLFDPSDVKLMVLGVAGVGKSALTVQFVQNYFVESYDPTIEDEYRKQLTLDDQVYMLSIYDTVQVDLASGRYFSQLKATKGFFVVYSVTSRSSFDAIRDYEGQLKRIKDDLKVPIVLVGNKADLESSRQVTTRDGQDLASQWRVPFFETSAKTGRNVVDAFSQLVREIVKGNGPSSEQEEEAWFISPDRTF